jgi:exopolysaccharide production protein ExoY
MISLEKHTRYGIAIPLGRTTTGRSSSDYGIRYNQTSYRLLKRAFDILVSLAMIVILSPVFLIVSLIIMWQNGCPILFRQKRIGRGGKLFTIYKFRTMVKNAEEVLRSRPDLLEEYQRTYKIANDPRILKIGRFLRSSSIDELPQLFNVLKGDMSLVGPRPIVEPELDKYGDSSHLYLSMKPGCAGLWQCSGRSDTTYDERVALDREYFYRSSLRYDMGIMGKTFVAVVSRRGAH